MKKYVKAARVGKTKSVYVVQEYTGYGNGWEDIAEYEDTSSESWKQAKADVKDYRDNGYSARIITRRVPNPAYQEKSVESSEVTCASGDDIVRNILELTKGTWFAPMSEFSDIVYNADEIIPVIDYDSCVEFGTFNGQELIIYDMVNGRKHIKYSCSIKHIFNELIITDVWDSAGNVYKCDYDALWDELELREASVESSTDVKASEYKLTDSGRKEASRYIAELNAKRKEILDAKKDTADETTIPTIDGIEDDVNFFGVDEDGEYYNSWGVTDNYNADYPLTLKLGVDFIESSTDIKASESIIYEDDSCKITDFGNGQAEYFDDRTNFYLPTEWANKIADKIKEGKIERANTMIAQAERKFYDSRREGKEQKWVRTELNKEDADQLKYYLKKHNIYYEPSLMDDGWIHFEVKATDEEVEEINKFLDSLDAE